MADMSISPYVFFNGRCREALGFYAEIFGTEPTILDASRMPGDMPIPEERATWVMHGMLPVNGGVLMASDNLFGTSDAMSGCSVQLNYPTAREAKTIFDALSKGGEITMAWEPTFWSAGFGTLTDRFGIRWMVGTDEAPAEGQSS